VVRVSEAQEPVNDVRAVRLLARRLGALD